MKKSLVAVSLNLWSSEEGAIISAELVLVMTISVLSLIVGLNSVSKSVNHELEDIAEAFGAISQTFCFEGIRNRCFCAEVSGSSFNDTPDVAACDCIGLDVNVGHISVPGKCE